MFLNNSGSPVILILVFLCYVSLGRKLFSYAILLQNVEFERAYPPGVVVKIKWKMYKAFQSVRHAVNAPKIS